MLAFNFFLVLFGFSESKWQGMHPEEFRMMQSETTSGSLSNRNIVDTTVERAESEKVATLLGLTQSRQHNCIHGRTRAKQANSNSKNFDQLSTRRKTFF